MNNASHALAIWSDLAPDVETDYRHWLTREHMLERVSVDGFVSGRAFCALDRGLRRYFIVYELADGDVLSGPAYLARLNDPTPWSRRIMPALQNFSRGGGCIAVSAGIGRGGIVVPLRFRLDVAAFDATTGQTFVDRLAEQDGVCRVWMLEVDRQRTTVATNEKRMRKDGDKLFDALVVIEGVEERPVLEAANTACALELAGKDVEPAVAFSLAFALDRSSPRVDA